MTAETDSEHAALLEEVRRIVREEVMRDRLVIWPEMSRQQVHPRDAFMPSARTPRTPLYISRNASLVPTLDLMVLQNGNWQLQFWDPTGTPSRIFTLTPWLTERKAVN